MTTDTATPVAHTAQTNIIKALSQQIWGSEWIILDEYGDSDGKLDRDLAVKLIDALHDVRKLPPPRLDDAQKLDALAKVLAGEAMPDEYNLQPVVEAEVQSVVEGPAAEPSGIVEEPGEKRPGRPPKLINHGTYGGYFAHKKRDEPVCDPCQEAAAEYWAGMRTRKKAKAAEEVRAVRNPQPNVEGSVVGSDAAFYDLAIGGLISLIPKTTDPFTRAEKERWLRYASAIIDVVWPNS